MLNEDPSEKQHPLESDAPRHPLEEPARPNRRAHPLEHSEPGAQIPRQQIAVAFPITRPYATYALMIINCLIFLAGLMYPDLREAIVDFAILYRPAVVEGGEYYRLFTSMFLHADVTHLFFNMYSLYIIGRSIEWIFGWQRFLLIYLLGGLGGSVLFTLSLGANGSGLGASGAVFAIWGADMIFLYRHRKELGAYAQMQLRQIVIVALLNLVLGATNPRIGTWAHIGGFVGGLALTWWLGPRLVTRTLPDNPDSILFAGRRYESALLPVIVYVVVLAVLLLVGINVL